MWEFMFGFASGAIASRLISIRNSKTRDAIVQVDDVIITPAQPIAIPKRNFVRGALSNFWGPDSPPGSGGNTTNSYSK